MARTQPFLDWVQKRYWAGCHPAPEERVLWCPTMFLSGLKYKLDKLANSIAMWRTLQPRTSRAEEPLGREPFIAPRGKKNQTWTHKVIHSRAFTWHNHPFPQTHAHPTEGAGVVLTGSTEQFSAFFFFLIKAHQINYGQLHTNPFLSANQDCLTGKRRSHLLYYANWYSKAEKQCRLQHSSDFRLQPEELL